MGTRLGTLGTRLGTLGTHLGTLGTHLGTLGTRLGTLGAHLGYCEYSQVFNSYVTSLYWAMTTLATIGYGDIVPKNRYEKIYACIVM